MQPENHAGDMALPTRVTSEKIQQSRGVIRGDPPQAVNPHEYPAIVALFILKFTTPRAGHNSVHADSVSGDITPLNVTGYIAFCKAFLRFFP